jgi:hypothetical protein
MPESRRLFAAGTIPAQLTGRARGDLFADLLAFELLEARVYREPLTRADAGAKVAAGLSRVLQTLGQGASS